MADPTKDGANAGNAFAWGAARHAGCGLAGRRAAWRAAALCVAALAIPGLLGAATPLVDGTRPTCIEVRAEARYRNYGYDHVVNLNNRCERAAQCEVFTDVNPNPIRVTVPSREEVEIVTFIGSPSSQFIPTVSCVLAPEPGDSRPRKQPEKR